MGLSGCSWLDRIACLGFLVAVVFAIQSTARGLNEYNSMDEKVAMVYDCVVGRCGWSLEGAEQAIDSMDAQSLRLVLKVAIKESLTRAGGMHRAKDNQKEYRIEEIHNQSNVMKGSDGTARSQVGPISSLKSIYDKLGGLYWNHQDNWLNETMCYCDWYGVSCFHGCTTEQCQMQECAVTGIQLFENNLVGNLTEIEADLEALSHLVYLDMDFNTLIGSLPSVFMPNIMFLYLKGNRLSGHIHNLANMPGVIEVDFSSNNFDSIETNMNATIYLQGFDASSNKLRSPLPEFVSPILSVLNLRKNGLYGSMKSFYYVPSLEIINLSNNRLSGRIPELQFSYLTILDVSSNYFVGSLPKVNNVEFEFAVDIGDSGSKQTSRRTFIPQISLINLSNNLITGTIPKYNIPSMMLIDASNNFLTGVIPSFETLNYLMTIDFSFNSLNRFDNRLPFNLQSLFINKNQIHGALPAELPPAMHFFIARDNPGITGALPPSYGLLTSLAIVDLTNTSVSGNEVDGYLPENFILSENVELSNARMDYMCPHFVGRRTAVDIYIDPSYFHYEFCSCLPDRYGYRNNCIPCESPCECQDGNIVSNCFPSPDQYSVLELIQCPLNEVCNPKSKFPFTCEVGYTGRLCTECETGYSTQGRHCLECPLHSEYYLPIILVFFLIALLAYIIYIPPQSTGLAKIFLFHIQSLEVVYYTAVLNAEGSSSIELFTSIATLRIPFVRCMLSNEKPHIILLIYVLFIFLVFLACGFGLFFFQTQKKSDKVIFVTLFLLHAMYFGISRQVFGTFGCTLYDKATDKWYLNSLPWLACHPMDAEYSPMLELALPSFIIYIIGFFIATYHLLVSLRPYMNMERIMQSYGFLYLSYRPAHWYWELVSMARRLLYSFLLSLIPFHYETTLRITIFLVMLASLFLQHTQRPYVSDLENRMELLCLYTLMLSFFGGLLFDFYGFEVWVFVLIAIPNVVVAGSFGYLLYPRFLSAAKRLTVAIRSSTTDFTGLDIASLLQSAEPNPFSEPVVHSPRKQSHAP